MTRSATTTDILVIGAGTAGMPCAIEAARAGAAVTVVEKSERLGGTLHYSGGQMSAAGTRRQQRKGIDDAVEQHFADILKMGGERVDRDLARLAANLAPQTVDWLEDLGFPFDPDCPTLIPDHEHYSAPRTYWSPNRGLDILATITGPWQQLVDAGRITVRLLTPAVALCSQDGRVTGATVEDAQSGTRQDVLARATVLTTGGFAASPEMFARFTPAAPPLASYAAETSTGDGVRMALRLGAQVRNTDAYMTGLGGFKAEPGPGRLRDWRDGWAMVGSANQRAPREIYVDASGRRFINEDEPSNDRREFAVMDLADETFWAVFDSEALFAGECLIKGWHNDDLLAAADAGQFCFAAASIEDLADRAGIGAEGLKHTVAEYNEAVVTGSDRLGRRSPAYPLKTPPFYAFRLQGGSGLSWAGLSVDAQLRVLNAAGEPIPGLYAAGEVLGMSALSGDFTVGGMSLTPALGFGRWLGQRLARGRGD